MDTVIDLRLRAEEDNSAYRISVFPIQDYRLVRAEVPKDLLAPPQGFRWGDFFAGKSRGTRRQRRRRALLAAGFRSELAARLDERDDIYCVSGAGLLPFPAFDGYLEPRWTRRLLQYAAYPHFVVLGTAPYLQEVLCGLAPRMKSLLWLLPDYCHAEMLEDFAEDFYQEYGLAIALRCLGIDESYGQARVVDKCLQEPVSILDFTQEKHIPALVPEAGGIWLDMASVDEKRRRIEARRLRINYFSLKKQWEQPQKAPVLLDTANKNRYNTKVNSY